MVGQVKSKFGNSSRARALLLLLVTCIFIPFVEKLPAEDSFANQFHFHHDHILGTSLDLYVMAAGPEEAENFEKAVLAEVERLRLILSTYDPASAVSRLNREAGPVPCPPELIEVLRLYEVWTARTQGALSGQLGTLIQVWKDAEQKGALPDVAMTAEIVNQLQRTGWQIDAKTGSVTRLTTQALNINAIGRGYILGKAAATAHVQVPAALGFLLDIGGDMVAWGKSPEGPGWRIGVANPNLSDENAPPLTRLRLPNGAVATSGPYQRFTTFGNKQYSHIFDPRTGRPAEGVASSTVLAPDSVTANALATALCVLTPEEGLRLANQMPGVECLLVTSDGRQWRSPGFVALENPLPDPPLAPVQEAAAKPWPKDFQAEITLTLANLTDTKRYRRPYVAVWLENDKGKAVRTLAVWGNAPKYQKDLTYWWKIAQNDKPLIVTVTRATRPPGQYQLLWEGKDDKGNPVDQGTYKVIIEVHREHGKHIRQMGDIVCGAEKTSVTLAKSLETEEAKVTYGPKGK